MTSTALSGENKGAGLGSLGETSVASHMHQTQTRRRSDSGGNAEEIAAMAAASSARKLSPSTPSKDLRSRLGLTPISTGPGTGPEAVELVALSSSSTVIASSSSSGAMSTATGGAQLKVDELMFKFLSQENNHAMLTRLVEDFEAGLDLQPSTNIRPLSSPVLSPRTKGQRQAFSPPRSPRSPASPRSSPLSSPRASPRARSPRAGLSAHVSPRKNLVGKLITADSLTLDGRGPLQTEPGSEFDHKTLSDGTASPHDESRSSSQATQQSQVLIPPLRIARERSPVRVADLSIEISREIDRYFDCANSNGICKNDFVSVCKGLCNFPTFLNESLCKRILEIAPGDLGNSTQILDGSRRAEGKSSDPPEFSSRHESKTDRGSAPEANGDGETYISKKQFLKFWVEEMEPYDDQDRFFRLLKPMHRDYMLSEDFMPHLEELLAYHPGLEFLESTPEFQEKYARTVAARIMFRINTSRSGHITRREFRKSDLLEVCHQVDEEEDINLVFKYFNYEGFYVCYVKFWELDTDHDFLLSKEDLMRHGGHALIPKIVDRIFEQPVYPFMSGDEQGRMGYEDFVYFFLAEEDKSNEASIRYWFDCVDLDGDGVITPWEMKIFYDGQLSRLQSYGHEAISFADVLCQAHDFVHPRTEGRFVLADFCKPEVIKISGMMFNILFNLNKFIAFEQRDPHWIRAQHENPDLTDWDRFVAIEYARLASAEEERELEEEDMANWSADGNQFDQQSWQFSSESPF